MIKVLKIMAAAILAAFPLASPALAQVSGPCANCHTMHNSQNGEEIKNSSWPIYDLLAKDCVGCHSATDGSTWKDPVTGAPIVYNTLEPTYGADAGDGKKQGLAGGNFYWVDQDDTFGHNVFNVDSNLNRAPGQYHGCYASNGCHGNLHGPIARDGRIRQGCTKCHLYYDQNSPAERMRYHHADDSALIINSRNQGWYRFLGSIHGATGAWGIEDSDWEQAPTGTTHNEYMGLPADKTVERGYFSLNGKSVGNFCVGCHNYMHVQGESAEGGDPWLKHPSDGVIPASGEYAGYTVYDPLTPVARPELNAVSGVVTPGADMVMCLSCHRAHGSPYQDMLRWDYSGMRAGGGGADGTGCFKCHTAKDGA